MVHIEFNDLNVEEVTKSSGIFSGNNLQVQWRAIAKSNAGFGTISGDKNRYADNQSSIQKNNR